jgi:hypothetical protein
MYGGKLGRRNAALGAERQARPGSRTSLGTGCEKRSCVLAERLGDFNNLRKKVREFLFRDN